MNFKNGDSCGAKDSARLYAIAQICCVMVMSYGVLVIGLAREADFKRIALGLFIAVYGAICALLNRFGAHVDRLVCGHPHCLGAPE